MDSNSNGWSSDHGKAPNIDTHAAASDNLGENTLLDLVMNTPGNILSIGGKHEHMFMTN
jgi:hypothetical protein